MHLARVILLLTGDDARVGCGERVLRLEVDDRGGLGRVGVVDDVLRVERSRQLLEALRVPLVMRYPPAIAAGTVRDQMVLNIDLAPTIADSTPDGPVSSELLDSQQRCQPAGTMAPP